MALIPTVDLSPLPLEDRTLLTACESIGCFPVINHGITSELQSEMKSAVKSLFDLSEEVKRRGNVDVISGSGYVGPTKENPLYEAFGLYDASRPTDVDAFCSRLHASAHHREIIKTYASKLHEVIVKTASKVAESMGLVGYSFEDWPCQFRINKYNFTEESVGSSGIQIHTDNSFLTVLQEDESVGGLEMMDKSGKFVAVDPVPGSFLINMSDIGQAWSNGRLHNVKHRVQCKEASERISIALFLLAPKNDIVEPPSVLVGSEHPRIYKSFNYHDYRKFCLSTGYRAGEALPLYMCNQLP